MKILVSCPPMLGLIEEFIPSFERQGGEVTIPTFSQTLSENELLELVPAHDGWIIGDDPATEAVFSAGAKGNLRAAVKWGVGVDNVDFDAAKDHGISISHTPDMFGDEVADLAFSYLVALARDTYDIDRGVREGRWPKPAGISLRGRTVGVLGLGDVGSSVVKRLLCAGMNVIGYDPIKSRETLDSSFSAMKVAVWPSQADSLDFLVLACSLNASNFHLIDRAFFATNKPGLRIVNVARGPLIDELALVEALNDQQVHSAALDVFEKEPLPLDSPLRTFPQVVFGSHNASNTVDAVRRTSEEAIHKLFTFLNEN